MLESPEGHSRQAKGKYSALKARDRKAQGGGRNAAEALGGNDDMEKPCKGGTGPLCRPYRALPPSYPGPQGSRARFRVLFHSGLCCLALSALRLGGLA